MKQIRMSSCINEEVRLLEVKGLNVIRNPEKYMTDAKRTNDVIDD
jgi:hypothetical protein